MGNKCVRMAVPMTQESVGDSCLNCCVTRSPCGGVSIVVRALYKVLERYLWTASLSRATHRNAAQMREFYGTGGVIAVGVTPSHIESNEDTRSPATDHGSRGTPARKPSC